MLHPYQGLISVTATFKVLPLPVEAAVIASESWDVVPPEEKTLFPYQAGSVGMPLLVL